MKFDLNEFRKNEDLATGGVWIPVGGGAEFKIASLDNPNFTEAFRKSIQPYQDLKREVPDDDQEEIMTTCMAKHVLLDWKNVFDGDEELEYSFENAKRIMKEIPDVRQIVLTQAQKVSNFREKVAKEIEGN